MNKLVLSALILVLISHAVHAETTVTATPIETLAKQAYLVDATTGTPLFTKESEALMPTSSMSKMMTVYVVFEALKSGKISMNDTLPVSEHAWRQEGSRMFLKIGQRVRVEDLIRGVIIQSGNDAAVVLAEGLGYGSETHFSELMNISAKKLGMSKSHFVNATGLPNPQHYSTAHDLATLALALQHDFPEHYHFFSEKEFTYNGIKQGNRNPLLYRNMNVDGLKTGHTDDGGFGLTASAQRDGRRLVLVLNGLNSNHGMQDRADESAKLLDWGFNEFGLYSILKTSDKVADVKVWLGMAPTVSLAPAENLTLTLAHSARPGLHVVLNFDQPLKAPVKKGQTVGKIIVSAPGIANREVALLANEDVNKLGFFASLMAKLHFLIYKA